MFCAFLTDVCIIKPLLCSNTNTSTYMQVVHSLCKEIVIKFHVYSYSTNLIDWSAVLWMTLIMTQTDASRGNARQLVEGNKERRESSALGQVSATTRTCVRLGHVTGCQWKQAGLEATCSWRHCFRRTKKLVSHVARVLVVSAHDTFGLSWRLQKTKQNFLLWFSTLLFDR